ncbi:hypothetical protein FJZ19_05760 [Candidatus Pacearchaeota archaeon]|nr:hypothetical protein [Candidatus Pacearchaeota archaeon]
MKQFIFFIAIISFSLLFVYPVSSVCINSADDYASEIVLNKTKINYNYYNLANAKNIIKEGDKYILQSAYSQNLAVILEKDNSDLSVRIQMPVKIVKKQIPYFKFSTTLSNIKINISEKEYNGWKINCLSGIPIPQCEFDKDKTSITLSLVSSNKYDVNIEINDELYDCGACDGVCIGTGEKKCIYRALKNDIQDILKRAHLISVFEEMMSSYRILGTGNILIEDLEPEIQESIDWKTAMNRELEELMNQNIISLSDSDINSITQLASQGTAGNSKIIYDRDKNNYEKWIYYSESLFSSPEKLKNCNEFSVSLLPAGKLSFEKQKISTYYLVPILITLFLFLLFLILIIIARLIDKKQRKKLRAATRLRG